MNHVIFPNLPALWTNVQIGNIVDIVYGEALRAEARVNKGGIPVYGSGGIVGEHDKALRNETSIVIGRKGTVGSIYYVDTPFWCIDTAFYLKNFRACIDIEYLAHTLRFIDLSRLTIVVGVPGVSRKDVESLSIPLPPLSEQQRIVEILRAVDELRRLRREADEKTETVLITVFNEMLGKPQDNWIEKRLGDVIKHLQPGKSLNGIDKAAGKGKCGILKVSAVTSGRFRPEENKELYEYETPSEALEVKDGDLLISRANTEELVGASAFVRNPPDKLLLSDKLWRVVLPEEPEISLPYLYALLNSPEMRIKISRAATGTSGSMKNISQENFLAIRFKMPPKYLQDELSNKIRILWDDVSGIQFTAKSLLDSLSRTILSSAFAGELTKEWRGANYAKLHTEAIERDRHLRRAAFAVRAEERAEAKQEIRILRIPAGRERYVENLSEKQRELLSLAVKLTGYFDVMRIYNEQNGNGKLSRAAIEQSLALLTETGLLRRVRVKSYNSEDDREVFPPAIRTLKDEDTSRLADVGEIDLELNPA